ncbi:hypothetical protein V5E97_26435 [Singulisphaera sp. Ch08]|uniref:Uncharacterized protein n=1 Tax=Singulisphaera sp. Ch08 TaxID=3120278 RepID=A0AAU7C9E5_9BACT
MRLSLLTTRRLTAVVVAVVVIVLLVLGGFLPFTRRAKTCVICRLNRVDSTYGPLPISRLHETNCSRWYAAHVEPEHSHIWEHGTCLYESDLYGTWRAFSCRPGHYPIFMLPTETQMRVYQHFKNPLDAKTLFANLTDAKTYNNRLDQDDEDRGHLTVRAMSEWESAGFPGTWDDWWSRFYARHVSERKEFVEWINSDSKVGFGEWRRQRKLAEKHD